MAKKTTKNAAALKKDTAELVALKKENELLRAQLAESKSEKKPGKKQKSFWRALGAGFFAILAVISFSLLNIAYWTKNTVINTDQFVSTMQPLIKDPDVQKALQTNITDEIFAQVNLEAELKKALPENLQFIAAPFAGQVKSFTYNKIGDVLNSQQAYDVWTKILQTGHSQIIAYIQDPNNSGKITVDSVYQLAGEQLKDSDVGFLFNKTLPNSVGTITLANVEGVPKARAALNALQESTIVLSAVAAISTILAIAMSIKRRNMIMGLSIATFIFMLATIQLYSFSAHEIRTVVDPQFAAASEAAYKIIAQPLLEQTQGIAAFIGSIIILVIVTSKWPSMVAARKFARKSLDFIFAKLVRGWGGAPFLNWIADNRSVISWTLIGVAYALFALRIPPTVHGVKEALIFSGVTVLAVEILSGLSRVTRK